MTAPDIIIIGAGIGGATLASALARRQAGAGADPRARRTPPGQPRSARPRGDLPPRAFVSKRPGPMLPAAASTPAITTNLGELKFYGAVLMRYREADFAPLRHMDGTTPGWPFAYQNLERYYCSAEALYQVRGDAAQDPTEPPRLPPFFPPVLAEPTIATLARQAFRAQGLRPATLPLGVDIDLWLKGGSTT